MDHPAPVSGTSYDRVRTLARKASLSGLAARVDRLSDRRFAVLSILPGVLIVGVLLVPPIAAAFGLSFFRVELLKDSYTPFVGLDNFARAFDDQNFIDAIPRTLLFALGTALLTIPLGLGAALILNRAFRGNTLLGIALLLPWAIAPVVTGLFWNFIFNGNFGLATGITMALGLTDHPIPWLQDTTTAFLIAIVATAWRSVPLVAILLLAALKTIPSPLYRAARMDGASAWTSFRYVTLPGIRNSLIVVSILQIIISLQTFDILYLLTGGGPGRETTVLSYYIYERTVQNLSFGYSSALAVILFLFIVVCSALLVRMRFRERRRAVNDGALESGDAAWRVDSTARLVEPTTTRRPIGVSVRGWLRPVALLAQRPGWRKASSWARRIGFGLAAALLFIWLVGPIAWLVIASVQPEGAVTTAPPQLTFDLQFERYWSLLSDAEWLDSLQVSLVVTAGTTVLVLVVGALAAYPLARLAVPGKTVLMSSLMLTQMIPAIVLAIPVLYGFQKVGLKDTEIGLILINSAFWLPVIIWILRGVFESVPRSLDAAGRMDGCSRLGVLWRVILPAARPGIAAASILVLIGTWNEFLFAVVLGDREAVTMTRRISQLQVIGDAAGIPPFTLVAAAGLLVALPCLVLALVFHRHIRAGLTEGVAKG